MFVKSLVLVALCLGAWWVPAGEGQVSFPTIYIRQPRDGDIALSRRIPDVFCPVRGVPGTDLMLRQPDGVQEVLVAGGADGVIQDPLPSFDAEWVYYVHYPNFRSLQTFGGCEGIPTGGADLWKINVATREKVKLLPQTWTPTPTIATWAPIWQTPPPPGLTSLTYGIFNAAPAQLPNGKLMFTSNRNGHLPTKTYTFPNFQLFVLDEATGIVEEVGYLNLGSALHPVVLKDGRVMWSSYESQGRRDVRLWSLWDSYPDGRKWGPLLSDIYPEAAFHWAAQRSDGTLCVIGYYNKNNASFGTLLCFDNFPIDQPPAPSILRFGAKEPTGAGNPKLKMGEHASGKLDVAQLGFSPLGLHTVTPFAHLFDQASEQVNGEWLGKVTMPSVAPGNDLLIVWSDGPANNQTRPVNVPAYDAGIYLLPTSVQQAKGDAFLPSDLILIVNDPAYNELQPKALVPYQQLYGKAQPDTLPWLPNDGSEHPALPAGTPFGLVGTSTFLKRDLSPSAESGVYTNADIHAVRILLQQPQSHLGRRDGQEIKPIFRQPNDINERLWVLGDIPLRKYHEGLPLMDVDGNPDTSFLAKIPADHVFTFATLDAEGAVLNISQTWHQVRPGEVRTDCGGCHAHSQKGTNFAQTAAGQPGYVPTDLTTAVPWTVEYADIKAILDATCPVCAGKTAEQVSGQAFLVPFRSRTSPLITQFTPTATADEKRLLRAWIDLGAGRSTGKPQLQQTTGWKEWNTRPTLHLQIVRTAPTSCPAGCTATQSGGASLAIGAFAYAGVQVVSVTTQDAPQTNRASQATPTEHPGIWHLPLAGTGQAVWTVRVQDSLGIWTEKRLAAQW